VPNLAEGKAITFLHAYSTQFPGAGNTTLIDGRRGTHDHSDGAWQGFEGVDLDARIDLGEMKTIRRITVSFLENQPAWIFLPKDIEISVSRDGSNFHVIKRWEMSSDGFNTNAHAEDVRSEEPISDPVRYIRVVGRNVGVCPSWHPGAGSKAWLFADEIVVE
jgi:hypothetical protein